MQTVTAADLQPAGWVCETCKQPFAAGDNAYGVPTGLTAGGDVVEGEWRCTACWHEAA